MNLARTTRGTIHERDCHYAGMAKPWLWADHKTVAQVLATCQQYGFRTCRYCKPLAGISVFNDWHEL